MSAPKFKVGDWVRINDGKFAGRIALVVLVNLDWRSFQVQMWTDGIRRRQTFAADRLDLHAAGPEIESD